MFWIELWAMLQVIGIAIPCTLLIIIGFYVGWQDFKRWVKTKRCKHDNYWENMRCHAICRDCGKDLGFIGTLREKRAKNNT